MQGVTVMRTRAGHSWPRQCERCAGTHAGMSVSTRFLGRHPHPGKRSFGSTGLDCVAPTWRRFSPARTTFRCQAHTLFPGHRHRSLRGTRLWAPSSNARRNQGGWVSGSSPMWWEGHEVGLCPNLVVLGQHASGGMAEYMVCRASTLVSVGPDVPVEVAALAEPTAVAVRAVAKISDLRGATVAVVGAGVVGNLVVQVARGVGAQVLVLDPSATQRNRALEVGAAAV